MAAPFFIELEERNGEYAAGQETHPPQRDARRRSTIRESAASGPSSRLSSWRLHRARRRMPPRRLKAVQPEIAARRRSRRYPQEHGRAEDFPTVQAGCVARLKIPVQNSLRRAVGKPAARFRFWTARKNAAIPAIRATVNARTNHKNGCFPPFSTSFGPFPMSRALYFTFVKKRHLHAASDTLRKAFPGANPRRGQERKEA